MTTHFVISTKSPEKPCMWCVADGPRWRHRDGQKGPEKATYERARTARSVDDAAGDRRNDATAHETTRHASANVTGRERKKKRRDEPNRGAASRRRLRRAIAETGSRRNDASATQRHALRRASAEGGKGKLARRTEPRRSITTSSATPPAPHHPPTVPRSILRDRMIDVVVRSTPSSVPIWSSRSLSRSGESARSHAT